MSSITEKIAMLLARANSPYEAEAKAALLKARELMVKHKLKPEDIEAQEEKRLVSQSAGVSVTKTSAPWASALAHTIANQYCCRHFVIRFRNRKTVEIGFAGFEEDFIACKLAYCYAFDSVLSYCSIIRKNMRGRNTAVEIRQMCNSYGWGFCSGLRAAFEAQTEQNQEWGLVMAVPKEVDGLLANMKKRNFARPTAANWNAQFAAAGYKDGKEFDPAHRLGAASEQGA